MVRWPGHIKAGSVGNEIVAHLDWMPTLLAAAGVPHVACFSVTFWAQAA
jgi:arylsulfatase